MRMWSAHHFPTSGFFPTLRDHGGRFQVHSLEMSGMGIPWDTETCPCTNVENCDQATKITSKTRNLELQVELYEEQTSHLHPEDSYQKLSEHESSCATSDWVE